MAGRTLWVANFDFEERLAREREDDPRAGVTTTLPAKIALINAKFAPRLAEVLGEHDVLAVPDAGGHLAAPDGRAVTDARGCDAIRFWGVNRWAVRTAHVLGFDLSDADVAECNAKTTPILKGMPREHIRPPGIRIVRDRIQLNDAIDEIARLRYRGWVAKAEYGAAGRNMRMRQGFEPTRPDLEWADAIFSSGSPLLVEPLFDVLEQVGFQYTIDESYHVSRVGTVPFETIDRGQFSSCGKPIPDRALGYWREAAVEADYAARRLSIFSAYTGPLGIDAMRVRHPEGGYAFHAVHDINARLTMGRLALKKADPAFVL